MANPIIVNQNTTLVQVDTSIEREYIIRLSSLNTPGSLITVRDIAGNASSTYPIIISTTQGVKFLDGGGENSNIYRITQPYGFMTITPKTSTIWGVLNTYGFPDSSTAANINNVTASSITVNNSYLTNVIISTALISTLSTDYIFVRENISVGQSTIAHSGFYTCTLRSLDDMITAGTLYAGSTVSSIFGNITSTLTVPYISTQNIEMYGVLRSASTISTMGPLFVGSSISTTGNLAVGGDTFIQGTLTVPHISTQNIEMYGVLRSASTISTMGPLFVGNSISTTGNLAVGGNTFIQGGLTVLQNVIFQSNLKSSSITVDGSVGIGKTSPAFELDISGNINFTGIINSNGFPVSFTPPGINSAGTIGINKGSNASFALDVSGITQIGTATLNGEASGDFILQSSQPGGVLETILKLNKSSVAIGLNAGKTTQGAEAIAIGLNAGSNTQAANSIAIGLNAGVITQTAQAIAIGIGAGYNTQGATAIALGNIAGYTTQGGQAIAIGNSAANTNQGGQAIAIGTQAAFTSQAEQAIAIGGGAGYNTQGTTAIALGANAGAGNQGSSAVAIGNIAGYTTQGGQAIAIGDSAGNNIQGGQAIAIGGNAGNISQGTQAIAIGNLAGESSQGVQAIAIGVAAGNDTQGSSAIALGFSAGGGNQGSSAIAIGTLAGQTNQAANSIILNASGVVLNNTTSGLFMKPIASSAATTNVLRYDTTTSEITYTNVDLTTPAGINSAGTIGINKGSNASFALDVSGIVQIGTATLNGGANGDFILQSSEPGTILQTTLKLNKSSMAIGIGAGQTGQATSTIAIGNAAGQATQSAQAIAIGQNAGQATQSANTIAIGQNAGQTTQGVQAIAIGTNAGQTTQSTNTISIGYFAGNDRQKENAVAIGFEAGRFTQSTNTVAIGYQAGRNNQGAQAVAIGQSAGQTSQAAQALAIGSLAGNNGQAASAIAIGANAGQTSQATNAIAIGYTAGQTSQATNTVAIGNGAGTSSQAESAVAIGLYAGQTTQSTNSIAIGYLAGNNIQKENAIAIGYEAGRFTQSTNTVAIGYQAGRTTQGARAVAIGYQAGQTSQATNTVAIGALAGQSSQAANSIVINASGIALNNTTSGVFMKPIASSAATTNFLRYDTTTAEITYTNVDLTTPPGINSTGNIGINKASNASFALDVSGTIHTSGAATFDGFVSATTGLDVPGTGTLSCAGNANFNANGSGTVTIGPSAGTASKLLVYGSVGIGTTTPLCALDASGAIRSYRNGSSNTLGTQSGESYDNIVLRSDLEMENGGKTSIIFGSKSLNGYYARIFAEDKTVPGQAWGGSLSFQTTRLALAGSFETAMTITNTGNVGIGITSPVCRLDVSGIINTNSGSISLIANQLSNLLGAPMDGIGYYNETLPGFTGYPLKIGGFMGTVLSSGNGGALSYPYSMVVKDGTVGVGVKNPTAKFQVIGNTNTTTVGGLILPATISFPGAFYNTIMSALDYLTYNVDANVMIEVGSANASVGNFNTVYKYLLGTSFTDAGKDSDFIVQAAGVAGSYSTYTLETILKLNRSSVAIGLNAGVTAQGINTVAIGTSAGSNTQTFYAVAVGFEAGLDNQKASAVAIGNTAGRSSQALRAIAIGAEAGYTTQGEYAIAIGSIAGQTNQTATAIAIGSNAGNTSQGGGSIAIGVSAGAARQIGGAVAIGFEAGLFDQAYSSIAIGNKAGRSNQPANSIILNATGDTFNCVTSGFFVNPVRNVTATNYLLYNATSGEISYSSGVPSDERLKTNINTLSNVLSSIKQIRGVRYNFKDNLDTLKIGVIAQEIEAVFPELIHTDDSDEKIKSMDYPSLTGVLLQGIKEQQVLIESQQALVESQQVLIESQQALVASHQVLIEEQNSIVAREAAEIESLKATVQSILHKYPI